MKNNNKNHVRILASTSLLFLLSPEANAGGFSLYTEGSASAVGNYAAGVAAEAADAAIGWYNPAGLVLIHQKELVVSGVGVFPQSKLSGTSTFAFIDPPNVEVFPQQFSGLDGAKNALVPALHYAVPLDKGLTAGISFVSPFGLSTEYSRSSPVRYAATLTELKTINVSPEIGYLLTDTFSVGLGLDLQWASVKFNAVAGAPFFAPPGMPTFLDSTSENEGNSFGMGFHVGALKQFNNGHTRVGINYQSKVEHKFDGHSVLTGRLADTAGGFDNPFATFRSEALTSNRISLPDIVTLSGYQDVTDQWALLGSIVFTGWDVFTKTELRNVAAFTAEGNQLADITNPQKYRDAWRFALGTNYRVNPQWLVRLGGGYDQTPTINAERDVRLPDGDRWALSAGAHYQMTHALGFDLGYTYLFAAEDPRINKTIHFNEQTAFNVNAKADAHAQLVGLQAVWDIE